ncbi:MAG: response regulator [Rhodopseudomonas sp.]|nr:response regulator [Rhodopseudomonas sp.]
MLRVVIVDDEPLARQGIRQLLAQHDSVQLVGEAGSVAVAAEVIQREKPDAVFLDIEMHGLTGFDLIKAVADPPEVVFVTAHSRYAVDAYDIAASDYLLKPVKAKRLAEAIGKLEKSQQAKANEALANAARETGPPVLRLKARDRIVILRIDSIAALRAEGDYTHVWAENRAPFLTGQPLGKLEAELPQPPFLRLGRSLIINTARLRDISSIRRDVTQIRLDGCAEGFVIGRALAVRLKRALGE